MTNAGSEQTENSFSYDVLGNTLTKVDVGTYTYPPVGSAQPHGVSSISPSGGGASTSFTYDANGNLTAQAGGTARSFTWTLFNRPGTIMFSTRI